MCGERIVVGITRSGGTIQLLNCLAAHITCHYNNSIYKIDDFQYKTCLHLLYETQ
jgi:hypothetical protein